jgi:hypothetical protein
MDRIFQVDARRPSSSYSSSARLSWPRPSCTRRPRRRHDRGRTSVTLDRDVRIAGANIAGALTFDATSSVSLLTDRNVVVTGSLTMAPASATTEHRLRFVDVDDTKFIGNTMGPVDGDVGLWVMGAGRLALNGAPKTAWTRATGAIAADQSSIALAARTVTGRQADVAGLRELDRLRRRDRGHARRPQCQRALRPALGRHAGSNVRARVERLAHQRAVALAT